MRKELQRVHIWSAVRVGFFFGLFFGFLFGLFNGMIIRVLATAYGSSFLPPGSEDIAELGGATLFVLAVFTALFFSLMSAFTGAIVAAFYNLVARLFGGIEIDVLSDELPVKTESVSSRDDENESDA